MGAFGNIVTRIKAVISADNKDFKKKMKATRADTKKTGKSIKDMGNVVKGVMAGVVVAAVAKGIKALLNIGKSLDLMSIKATAVFGLYRKEVEGMADDTASSMGLTKTEFMNAAAGIQDLLIPIGFARKEATGMTKELMGLSGALSTWTGGMYSAKEVGDIFAKAMLGEREQLKSLGIAISEQEIQLELAAKGMKKLTGEALAQAKAQITMDLITRKSTDAQEAFNTAQDSLVVTMAKTGGNIRSMGENLAIILNPALRGGADQAERMTGKLAELLKTIAIASQTGSTAAEKFIALFGHMGLSGAQSEAAILNAEFKRTARIVGEIDDQIASGANYEDQLAYVESYGQKFIDIWREKYGEWKKLKDRQDEEDAIRIKASTERQQAAWAAEMVIMRANLLEMGILTNSLGEIIETSFEPEPVVKLADSTVGLGVAMDKIPESMSMASLGVAEFGNAADYTTNKIERLKDSLDEIIDREQLVSGMFETTAMAAVYAAKQEEASFESVAKASLNAARDMLGAAMIRGIGAAVASALEEVAFPWNILAAAGAGLAAGVLFETIVPSFAEGGMVTGPTMAMVGDNPSGKELIIPWEKVGDLGGGLMAMDGIVRGRDLHLMGKRYNEKLTRAGRT